MLKKSYLLTGILFSLVSLHATEYFVAPNGTPGGNGSKQSPWDLQTAISRSTPVRAGDTVWMRGGTYTGNFDSYLTGGTDRFVTLRGYTNEHVLIDGGNAFGFPLTVNGSWTIYRDFEVIHSGSWASGAPTPIGIQCLGPNVKIVNVVVHDAGMGIGFWTGSVNSEIYGCILYNNGATSLEHGIYTQNDTGTKRIHDTIIFNNSGFGIHAYTQGGQIRGFDIEGVIAFNSGSKLGDGNRKDNILVGGNPPSDRLTVVSNYTFVTPGVRARNVRLSYGDHFNNPQGTANVRDNYIAGGYGFEANDWQQIYFSNNVVAVNLGETTRTRPPNGVSASAYHWDENHYYGHSTAAAPFITDRAYTFSNWKSTYGLDSHSSYDPSLPRGVKVVVRPNKYEPKRAHVVVYNWDLQNNVNVDLSGVLSAGDSYEVRNVQDYFGKPVLSGTYGGGAVSVPMTNLSVALPKRRSADPAPTGPLFNVFVVQGTGGGNPD